MGAWLQRPAQLSGKTAHGQEHRHPGVGEEEEQPVARVGRVERHVGAAGLEHREERRQEVEGARQAEPHPHLRPHPQPAQASGEPPGPQVEVAVGEEIAVQNRRRSPRPPRRPALEVLVEAELRRVDRGGDRGVVPAEEELVPLREGEERQLGDRPLRLRHHPREETFELPEEAEHGVAPEEVGVVAEDGLETRAALLEDERQVELRRPAVAPQGREDEPGEGQVSRAARPACPASGPSLLHDEHHLEERRMFEAPLDRQLLDQLLQGDVLVGIGAEGGLPRLLQDVAEAGPAGEPGAEDESVDEEADQPLDLPVGAPGDRGAHRKVALAGPAEEEGVPGGEESHEEGRLAAPGDLPEALPQGRRQRPAEALAVPGVDRRPREVDRQIEDRRRAGQPLPPVGELGRQHLAGQPPPLPDGEVRVLDGERRERRGAPLEEGPVEGRDLADEDLHRPAVGDDVVHGEEEGVLLRPQAEGQGAEERPGREIEGAPGARREEPLGEPAAHLGRQAGEVDDGEGDRPRRRDHLHRLTARDRESRAERLVPSHHLREGGGEEADLATARQPGAPWGRCRSPARARTGR